MEKCEFSEKLFENLVNAEILNRGGLDIYIPSQRKESKSGLDALFQTKKRKVLLIQYKISSRYELKKTPSGMNYPTYKFNIYKNKSGDHTQHNKLVEKIKKGLKCGYGVPLFHTYRELYDLYHSGQLLNFSYLISPTSKIIDNASHYVDYDDTMAIQHSPTKSYCEKKSILIELNQSKGFSKDEFIKQLTDSNNEKDVDRCLIEMKAIVLLGDEVE